MAIKVVFFQIYCILSLYLVTIIGRRILDRGKGFDYVRHLAKFIHPIYAIGWLGFLVSSILVIPTHPQPLSLLPRFILPCQLSFPLYLSFFILSAIVGLPGIGGLASRKVGPIRLMTRRFIKSGIRRYLRNPMSLGGYLFLIGYAIAFSSSYLLLVSLAGIIPAHIFYLKIYEEKELELKFGEEYLKYKKEVPFLLPRIKKRQKAGKNF
ncbi:hypothetical protein L6386_06280 [bacterium]|nr:hypothetical protein [bacterium]MBU4310472.1 hypothetical protein [bacterium]MCG2678139.1 hypothetical protein [bacterium]